MQRIVHKASPKTFQNPGTSLKCLKNSAESSPKSTPTSSLKNDPACSPKITLTDTQNTDRKTDRTSVSKTVLKKASKTNLKHAWERAFKSKSETNLKPTSKTKSKHISWAVPTKHRANHTIPRPRIITTGNPKIGTKIDLETSLKTALKKVKVNVG